MPKPIYGEPGSGMHLHTYLVKNGASLMGDEHSPTRLSAIGRHYVGGILEHAPSLCALTNPSTNSYRRLIPGFEAPVLVFFSLGNRTAAIRIPGYITSAKDMAVEYRIPDATANPYLALAAVLMAALDGLRRKVDPGAPMKGRLEGRETELEAREPGAGPRALPTSLGQALREMKQDCGYLKHDGVFPASLLDKWFELKAVEADAVMKRPHPWEFSLYYGS
jgi:glutamine synthetase